MRTCKWCLRYLHFRCARIEAEQMKGLFTDRLPQRHLSGQNSNLISGTIIGDKSTKLLQNNQKLAIIVDATADCPKSIILWRGV
jgi:hypothetical protein